MEGAIVLKVLISFIAILLECKYIHTLHIPSSYRTRQQDYVTVSFRTEDLSRTSRPWSTLPSSINTTLKFRNKYVHFSLVVNDDLLSLPDIYQVHGGSIVRYSFVRNQLDHNQRFYHDFTQKASIYIQCKQLCSKYLMTGTFVFDNETYIITPSSSHGDNKFHMISRAHSTIEHGNDFVVPDEFHYKNSKIKDLRQKRQLLRHVIELFFVTDYSVFKFWMDESGQNRTLAIDRIQHYYAFMVNGIRIRYNNLPLASRTFSIGFLYVGLYIAEDVDGSPWTELEKQILPNGEVQINADNTLARFSNWVQSNLNILNDHDHAVLFTKYNLIRSSKDISGIAYLGAMCADLSQSVVEERFNFISQTVAAHEIGHSLGAIHDGEQNDCDGTAGYVMANVSRARIGDNAKNLWLFSTCSVEEIQTVIDTLNQGVNCMLITSSTTTPIDVHPYLNDPLGQVFDIDKQCQMIFGSSSYANRVLLNNSLENICTGMWCSVGGNSFQLVLPAEGTSCGNQKWCLGNSCITDMFHAPTIDESCPYGDTPLNVIQGQNCASYINSNPWSCYQKDVYSTCCNSCSAYRINDTDCAFGDFADCSIFQPSDCYTMSDTLKRRCCGFCRDHEMNIIGCKYGDRSNLCLRHLCPYYSDPAVCCLTCNNYTTTVAPTKTTTESGCPYGDRISGCQVQLCPNYAEPELCCYTCRSTTPAATTVHTTTLMTTTTTVPTTTITTTVLPITSTTTTTTEPTTTTAATVPQTTTTPTKEPMTTTTTTEPTTSTTSTTEPVTTTTITELRTTTTTTKEPITTTTIMEPITSSTTTKESTTTTTIMEPMTSTTTTSKPEATTTTDKPTTTATSTMKPTTTTTTTTKLTKTTEIQETTSPTKAITSTKPSTTKAPTTIQKSTMITIHTTITQPSTTARPTTTTQSTTTTVPSTTTQSTTTVPSTTTQSTTTTVPSTTTQSTATMIPSITTISKTTTQQTTTTSFTTTKIPTTTQPETSEQKTTTAVIPQSTTTPEPTTFTSTTSTPAETTPTVRVTKTDAIEAWVIPVVAVLGSLLLLTLAILLFCCIYRRTNGDRLLSQKEVPQNNIIFRQNPDWDTKDRARDNRGYVADETKRNIEQRGTYLPNESKMPTYRDYGNPVISTPPVTKTNVSLQNPKSTRANNISETTLLRNEGFSLQHDVISERTENQSTNTIDQIGILPDEKEYNAQPSPRRINIQRGNSKLSTTPKLNEPANSSRQSSFNRQHSFRQRSSPLSSNSKRQDRQLIQTSSVTGRSDSYREVKVFVNPKKYAKQRELKDNITNDYGLSVKRTVSDGDASNSKTLLTRNASDSIVDGSIRDRRLHLRDKWLKEQQARNFLSDNDTVETTLVNFIYPQDSAVFSPLVLHESSPLSSPRYPSPRSFGRGYFNSKPVMVYTDDGESIMVLKSHHSFGRKRKKHRTRIGKSGFMTHL